MTDKELPIEPGWYIPALSAELGYWSPYLLTPEGDWVELQSEGHIKRDPEDVFTPLHRLVQVPLHPTADAARLASAERRIIREEKKSAAANAECDALRQEIRALRLANFILRRNAENTTEGNYQSRYEKLEEVMRMIRELTRIQVNGVPHKESTTLEPWTGPSWAKSKGGING